MAKQIARLLKADIQESSDLKSIAKMLSKKGRGGDTMLAHITPKEAKILKEAGGAGTVNPDTGLLEFYDGGFDIGSYGYDFGADYGKTVPNYIPPETSGYGPYSFSADAAPAQLTPSNIDPLEYYAGQQYADSAFGYQPVTSQTEPDDYYFPARGEFPPGMGARTDLVLAQREAAKAAGYPQGMMDIPADVGAA